MYQLQIVEYMKEIKTRDYQDFTTKSMSKEDRDKLNVGDIYNNAIQCKNCNDIIRSKNRHDFVACSCGQCSVDGGSWYQRCLWKEGNPEDYFISLIEYYDNV